MVVAVSVGYKMVVSVSVECMIFVTVSVRGMMVPAFHRIHGGCSADCGWLLFGLHVRDLLIAVEKRGEL
jgi:hypothetical protein